MLDEPGWKAENTDIQDNIRNAGKNVHNRIVCRRSTGHPITRDRPDLEEGREEE